jgi:hypothetical protein
MQSLYHVHGWRRESTRRTCQFQDIGREVFKDRRSVNGGLRANAKVVLSVLFQVFVDTANGELEARRPRNTTDLQLQRTALGQGEKEADLKACFRAAGLEPSGIG